jgi:hypothetical protein
MPADVVEGADDMIFTQHDQDREPCDFHGDVVSRLVESAAVSNTGPCLN